MRALSKAISVRHGSTQGKEARSCVSTVTRAYLHAPPIAVDGRLITDVTVTVLEWRAPTTRSLYFCNADGIARHSMPMSTLRAPGFDFTAYLRSPYVQELYDSNDLFIGQLHPGVKALYDAALLSVRDHFRQRLAERSAEVVDQWKREGIYPYEGEPNTPVERTERQVFELVAVNVNDYLPDFPSTDVKARQFSLRLVACNREVISMMHADSVPRTHGRGTRRVDAARAQSSRSSA